MEPLSYFQIKLLLNKTQISCNQKKLNYINSLNDEGIRHAAVLVPLLVINDTWHLLLTKRSEDLANHSGQVSFPGGAWEETDENLEATALREAWEEIGVSSDKIEILGCLEPRMLISGFLVTPVIGKISWPIELKVRDTEVEKVFSIPLPWLINDDNRYTLEREWLGTLIPVTYFKPYADEILWGATASMSLELMKILGLIK